MYNLTKPHLLFVSLAYQHLHYNKTLTGLWDINWFVPNVSVPYCKWGTGIYPFVIVNVEREYIRSPFTFSVGNYFD